MNKKGAVEAINFIFFVIISILLVLVFIIGVNIVKKPSDFLGDTMKESDSNFFVVNLLKYPIVHEGGILELNEALLLFLSNYDPNLRVSIETNVTNVINAFYIDSCWRMKVEGNGQLFSLSEGGPTGLAFCQMTKSKTVDSEIFMPSRNGIIKYNLVVYT